MSRFVDFLIRAYAPLAARHALVENAFLPARAGERTPARDIVCATTPVAAMRPPATSKHGRRRSTSLAA